VQRTACGPRLGLLSTTRIRVDVGDHARLKNGFAVRPAIVDTIETDDAALEIHADRSGDARHFGQGLAQQRRFVAIARAETNGAITLQLRSQKATTLSPFSFLCPLKPMLSPPFLLCSGRPHGIPCGAERLSMAGDAARGRGLSTRLGQPLPTPA